MLFVKSNVRPPILHQDLAKPVRLSVVISTPLPNEFLFENYFKLYEKAQRMGDSELSATAKALKYALVLNGCWPHLDVGDNLT